MLPEWFALGDIAYMNLDHRHGTFFDRIAQRDTRMAVPAGIEDDSVVLALALALAIGVLKLIDQIAFVVGLKVRQMHLRPGPLDVQQNLCHCLRTVYLRLPYA